MKRAAFAVLFVVWVLFSLWAEDQPATIQPPTVTLSIEEIARRAQSRNLEVLKAARSVERARRDLVGEPELMDSSLSVGGGYTSGGGGTSGWYGQSNLTLPLLPQLSVGGSVSVEEQLQFGESVSLSVKPLTPGRQTYSEEKSYKNAVVQERYLKRQIYLDAEQAALNLLIRDMQRELAHSTVELEQKNYELVQRRQELGDASFQDVQDKLVDLLDARQNLFNSEQRYLSDWKTLQLLFAPSEERIDVAPLSVDGLLELAGARRTVVERSRDIEPVTQKLETLKLELVALQAELKATAAWRPDLNLSAAVAFPEVSPSLSLNLSFSPNQLKRDEREELEQDIEVKRMEIATEAYTADLQKQLGAQSIAIAEEALASMQAQRERDRVAQQEAQLLFQQGKRTTLELEQLRLNLWGTEISSFQAATEVYRTQGDYLMLFVPTETD